MTKLVSLLLSWPHGMKICDVFQFLSSIAFAAPFNQSMALGVSPFVMVSGLGKRVRMLSYLFEPIFGDIF